VSALRKKKAEASREILGHRWSRRQKITGNAKKREESNRDYKGGERGTKGGHDVQVFGDHLRSGEYLRNKTLEVLFLQNQKNWSPAESRGHRSSKEGREKEQKGTRLLQKGKN